MSCQIPVLHQLSTIEISPFDHHAVNASRKYATVCSESRNFDQRFTTTILRVEMRRLVVVMIKVDRNTIELANTGHIRYTLTFGAASPVSGR